MCPQVASGAAACVEGTCALVSCETGWSDADGDPLNGCECPLGQLEDPGVGDVCIEAKDLGTVMDNGDQLQVTDNIASDDPLQGDEDWYKFTAVDGADPSGCDTFNLRISFLHNPQDQFVFDVYQGGCAGSQEICTEVDLFTHTTNINTTIGEGIVGECPCHEGEETVPDFQQCSDQTDIFIVRVRRRFGLSATCAAYTLKIENG
jgi:hypothetical protein